MLGGLSAQRHRTKKGLGAARRRYVRYVLVALCGLVALLPSSVFFYWRWTRGSHGKHNGARVPSSGGAKSRPPSRRGGGAGCHPETKVYAVGGCKPLFTVMRVCPTSMEAELTILKNIRAQVEEHFPGKALRELVEPNGTVLNVAEGAHAPKVHALLDKEMFVFPACTVGDVYNVELPSYGGEIEVKVLSDSPRVLEAESFLSPLECDALIATARSHMGPSTVSAAGEEAKNVYEQSRTSSTAWLHPESYPLASKLRTRVAELIGINFDLYDHVVTEDLQVLRYELDQHYHTHHDYFEPDLHKGFLMGDGRNRFITVFFYLTDVAKGGETMFPMAGDDRVVQDWADCSRGLRVPPKKGNAIIFYSLKPDGQQSGGLDAKSWHAGCDVKEGTKWAANYWITLKGVHPPAHKAPKPDSLPVEAVKDDAQKDSVSITLSADAERDFGVL